MASIFLLSPPHFPPVPPLFSHALRQQMDVFPSDKRHGSGVTYEFTLTPITTVCLLGAVGVRA